jgi:2-polyprenyl-6-methoxyphenol hydroxylase-like FAD-dependent oxidoreductase
MQHVGVFDELRARGHNYDEIAVSNDSGQQLARFLHGSEKFYNFAALRISRRRVQQVLLDEVKAQGIQIHYGMRLAKVEEETDSVVKLQFRNGQTVEADFVIGTDGVHSVVRDHVVPGTEPYYSGFMGITGKLPRDKLHESSTKYHLPNMFFGKSGFLAAMPSNYPGTEIGFFSTMTFPARSRKEWDDLANKRDELKEILIHRFGKEWLELVQGICKEVSIETLDLWPYVFPI